MQQILYFKSYLKKKYDEIIILAFNTTWLFKTHFTAVIFSFTEQEERYNMQIFIRLGKIWKSIVQALIWLPWCFVQHVWVFCVTGFRVTGLFFCPGSNFHTFINTLSLTLLSIAQAHLHLNNFIHCNLHTLSLSHVNLNIKISQTGHLSTIQSSTFK